jgi:dTDP-4-amino-4,6-dideoxygalactose transaminase
MRIQFIDLHAQYLTIKEEIDAAIAEVLSSTSFIGGKCVKEFEEAFADYIQADTCVGVGNGTDALEIVLEALDLPPNSEILVPVNTFIATAEAVTRSGYRVRFCDCDPATYTISIPDAERRITPSTRAIIPVHLYGQPCDMDAVVSFAKSNNLVILEDCAQAHGAAYKGCKVGTFGDAATFSFYPGKNLGAYGDAGAIVSNNLKIASKCRMIANHGRVLKYVHEIEGRNSRLDGLQAAVLQIKLCHLEDWTELRRRNATEYSTLLAGTNVVTPFERDDIRHVYHLYVILVDNRDKVQAELLKAGIETGIHYPVPLHLQPAYLHLGHCKGDFPVAEELSEKILSLPLFPELSTEQIAHVCSEVEKTV